MHHLSPPAGGQQQKECLDVLRLFHRYDRVRFGYIPIDVAVFGVSQTSNRMYRACVPTCMTVCVCLRLNHQRKPTLRRVLQHMVGGELALDAESRCSRRGCLGCFGKSSNNPSGAHALHNHRAGPGFLVCFQKPDAFKLDWQSRIPGCGHSLVANGACNTMSRGKFRSTVAKPCYS